MKTFLRDLFKSFTRFELLLWLSSLAVITASSLLSGKVGPLALVASLLGVTALIFVAKGYVAGQILVIAFALLYGAVSFFESYYGEMITYIGMSLPMAAVATVSWIRHPHRETKSVEIYRMKGREVALIALSTVAVTVGFYFILAALNTAELLVSTISVATSFFASMLVFFRSPYYGIAYALNDIVLIVLWLLAAFRDISSLPMVFCFLMFLLNDIYGTVNWLRMQKEQEKNQKT